MWRTFCAGLLVLAGVMVLSHTLQAFQVRYVGESEMELQRTPVTCGPASLAYILGKMGVETSEGEISRLAGTDEVRGTTLLGLSQAAHSFGVSAYGLSGSYKDLLGISLPAVAVFPGHFVVVMEADRDHVMVADPLVGTVRYGRAAFDRIWTGQLLVLERRNEGWEG